MALDLTPPEFIAPAPKRSRVWRLPLIGEFALAMQMQILAAAFLLFLIAGAFVAIQDNRAATHGSAQLAVAGEMRTLSQQVARAAQGALTGQPAALADLRTARERFAQLLSMLANGGQHRNQPLPPISPSLYTEVEDLRAQWDRIDRPLQVLLAQEKSLTALGKLVSDITEQSAKAADLAAEAGGSLPLLVERIGRNATLFLASTVVDEAPAVQLGKDLATAVDLAGKAKEQELQALLKSWQAGLVPIATEIRPLLQAKQAAGQAIRHSAGLRESSDKLAATLEELVSGRGSHQGVVATFAAAALLMLVLMVKAISDDGVVRREEAEARRHTAEAANAATQAAVARLAAELATLAGGDLSLRATVSDDLTRPVSEALNRNLAQLAQLVRQVQDTARRTEAAVDRSVSASDALLTSADTQSDQIRHASGLALSVAAFASQITDRAREAALASQRSLGAAERGTAAVGEVIAGLDDTRRRIEESARRIRRLDNSSQEIGEVAELIADISEQTNVLALNAAIQAASAGEAGRGFSVVAEEVQRLAERSADAARQIAALVRTLQNDTHDAVGSLERSSDKVLEGARLSDTATEALGEIADVARHAAYLIDGLAGDALRQSQTVTELSTAVKEIQRLTEQAANGIQQTANAVGEMHGLADDLKDSVAGFKV